ncbi:hypothetical protein GBS0709_16820 [Edwardsiella tarda]|nr:hypothetical protein GBS0709_16820 [Edwardsiella tarda]
MSRENSRMAALHCKRAEELAGRGLNRRALTELAKAAVYSDAYQINDVVARRNELSLRVRGAQRISGDPRMDYDNCVGGVL